MRQPRAAVHAGEPGVRAVPEPGSAGLPFQGPARHARAPRGHPYGRAHPDHAPPRVGPAVRGAGHGGGGARALRAHRVPQGGHPVRPGGRDGAG
eukprot:4781125-Lingulodinium_polyedra.AAC.1